MDVILGLDHRFGHVACCAYYGILLRRIFENIVNENNK